MALSSRAKSWIKSIAISAIAIIALRGACRDTHDPTMRREMQQEIKRLESQNKELERKVAEIEYEQKIQLKIIDLLVQIEIERMRREKDPVIQEVIRKRLRQWEIEPEPLTLGGTITIHGGKVFEENIPLKIVEPPFDGKQPVIPLREQKFRIPQPRRKRVQKYGNLRRGR